jgi:hypothetical protein
MAAGSPVGPYDRVQRNEGDQLSARREEGACRSDGRPSGRSATHCALATGRRSPGSGYAARSERHWHGRQQQYRSPALLELECRACHVLAGSGLHSRKPRACRLRSRLLSRSDLLAGAESLRVDAGLGSRSHREARPAGWPRRGGSELDNGNRGRWPRHSTGHFRLSTIDF